MAKIFNRKVLVSDEPGTSIDNKLTVEDVKESLTTENVVPQPVGVVNPVLKTPEVEVPKVMPTAEQITQQKSVDEFKPWEQSFADYAKHNERSISDAYTRYNKLREENGLPIAQATDYMAVLMDRDANKSVAQNEAEAKKLARQEKWQKIGNMLLHLGNFGGAVAGNTFVPQTESAVELTARQKKVRDAVLAQRNAYNQNLLTQIYKDRADQRAADLNAANIAAKEADIANRTAATLADIELARKRGGLTDAQAQAAREKAERDARMEEWNIKNIQAGIEQKKASAAASRSTVAKNNLEGNIEEDFGYYYSNFPELARDYMNANNIGSGEYQEHWNDKGHREAFVSWAKGKIKKDSLKPKKSQDTMPGVKTKKNNTMPGVK